MRDCSDILVSVVMPVFNGEAFLREAIDSILAQSYRNFEFIIVNDGSTDSSAVIVKSYKDERIIYLENESNQGNAFSRNRGHSMAKGKYIIIQDCDDISLPHRIERQVAFMESHPDIGIAGSFIRVIELGREYVRTYPVNPAFIKAWLFFRNPIAQPSVIIRRSILTGHKLTHLKYFEDFNLWYQASKVTDITNIPEVLVYYRFFETEQKQKHRQIKELAVKVMFRDKLKELGFTIPDSDFDLLSDFVRGYVRIDSRDYKKLSAYLGMVGRANREQKIYPVKEFEKCLLYDHLRLWKFLWKTKRFKSLLYLCNTFKKILQSAYRI